ncbi:hypothetical protein, partial [Streptomyces sp. ZEA17I]|uniref:hypothetical protein n=1 Tax=Streptomyces sp. ZEA17I TaxID=2202516 RepID=UPI001C63DD45
MPNLTHIARVGVVRRQDPSFRITPPGPAPGRAGTRSGALAAELRFRDSRPETAPQRGGEAGLRAVRLPA